MSMINSRVNTFLFIFFSLPTDTTESAVNWLFLGLAYNTKKGVGVCSSAHPGAKGLRIAHITQDRQRQLAHASTDYIE